VKTHKYEVVVCTKEEVNIYECDYSRVQDADERFGISYLRPGP
jgi:hypothetical protein